MTVRFGKLLAASAAAALLMVAVPAEQTAAQTNRTNLPGSWATSINVQNISTSATPASVTIDFYTETGTQADSWSPTETIPRGVGRSYFIPTAVPGLAAGGYAAVVNATEPVQVVVNSSSSGPVTSYSYAGIDPAQAANTIYFPGLYKSYFGFNSEFVLQNTNATTAANVSAEFFNNQGNKVGATVNLGAIPPNASKTFSTGPIASLPSGSNGNFSAKITSTGGAIAGISNSWTGAVSGGASSSNAFTAGSNEAYAPVLMNNYYGYNTALVIQNVDTAAAQVTLQYSNNQPATTFALGPGEFREFYQPGDTRLPSGNANGRFSAKVSSTGGKIVALVNESSTGSGFFASYNAPVSATASVNVPIVMSAYFNFFTSVVVQPVGLAAGQTTNIKVTYGVNGTNGQPITYTYNNVGPAGIEVNQSVGANGAIPANTVTSAVFESTNGTRIVAVANESTVTSTGTPGDYLYSYTGFPR